MLELNMVYKLEGHLFLQESDGYESHKPRLGDTFNSLV